MSVELPDAATWSETAIGLEEGLRAARFVASKQHLEATDVDEIVGSVPVMLVSVHGVPYLRGAGWKSREPFTASLVWQLTTLLGCHGFVCKARLPEDASYDERSRVRDRLREFIVRSGVGLVIDLHGAHADHPFRIAIGTCGGVSMRSAPAALVAVKDALAAYDVQEVANGTFSARGKGTVTRVASEKLGVPALQVEISRNLRRPRNYPEPYAALSAALGKAVMDAAGALPTTKLKTAA